MWIFSLAHAGVLGYESADVLADAADVRDSLMLDPRRAERGVCMDRIWQW